jgi:VanZ family protein
MRAMRSPIAAWLLVAGWAAVIFALSDVPSLAVAEGTLDLVLRKAAHIAEYAILAGLLVRAVSLSGVRRPTAAAATLAIAYAVSDEWHQTFVEGRSGAPRDVAIDAIGVAIGCVAVTRLGRPRPRPA